MIACRKRQAPCKNELSKIAATLHKTFCYYTHILFSFRYVDLQRGQWIRQNVSEAEELYNHVGEMFNIFQTSAYFKKEETNFQVVKLVLTAKILS